MFKFPKLFGRKKNQKHKLQGRSVALPAPSTLHTSVLDLFGAEDRIDTLPSYLPPGPMSVFSIGDDYERLITPVPIAATSSQDYDSSADETHIKTVVGEGDQVNLRSDSDYSSSRGQLPSPPNYLRVSTAGAAGCSCDNLFQTNSQVDRETQTDREREPVSRRSTQRPSSVIRAARPPHPLPIPSISTTQNTRETPGMQRLISDDPPSPDVVDPYREFIEGRSPAPPQTSFIIKAHNNTGNITQTIIFAHEGLESTIANILANQQYHVSPRIIKPAAPPGSQYNSNYVEAVGLPQTRPHDAPYRQPMFGRNPRENS